MAATIAIEKTLAEVTTDNGIVLKQHEKVKVSTGGLWTVINMGHNEVAVYNETSIGYMPLSNKGDFVNSVALLEGNIWAENKNGNSSVTVCLTLE